MLMTNKTNNSNITNDHTNCHDKDCPICLAMETYKVEIKKNWNKSRECIIEVGKSLSNAKKDFFKNNREIYERLLDEVGITSGTADKLITIAGSKRITSKLYKDILPVSYGTLYEIATLDQDTFEGAITDKVIHPNCFRKDVEYLKKDISPKSQVDSAKDNPVENLKLVSVFVDETKFDNTDDYLNMKNLVVDGLKDVSGIRLDFSSLDKQLEKMDKKMKKAKKSALKQVANVMEDAIHENIRQNPELVKQVLGNSKTALEKRYEYFGFSKKLEDRLIQYSQTLHTNWKIDWRNYTIGTCIEQKPVGNVPAFDMKIAA